MVPTAVGGDTSPSAEAVICFERMKDHTHPTARIPRTTAPVPLRFRSARAERPDRPSLIRHSPHENAARLLPLDSRRKRPGGLGWLPRHESDRVCRNRLVDRILSARRLADRDGGGSFGDERGRQRLPPRPFVYGGLYFRQYAWGRHMFRHRGQAVHFREFSPLLQETHHYPSS